MIQSSTLLSTIRQGSVRYDGGRAAGTAEAANRIQLSALWQTCCAYLEEGRVLGRELKGGEGVTHRKSAVSVK